MRNNSRLPETVSQNVRAELSRRRITQLKAAKALDLSQAAFSKRVNGYIPFSLRELDQLSELLDVPPAVFVTPAHSAVSA